MDGFVHPTPIEAAVPCWNSYVPLNSLKMKISSWGFLFFAAQTGELKPGLWERAKQAGGENTASQ